MPQEVWSFIELEKGKLHDTVAKMASEAKRHSRLSEGKPCGVFFSPSASFLKELEVYGLEKIYFSEVKDNVTPEALADNFCSLISKWFPELVLFAHTPLGAELGARIAAKLGKGFISNCVDFEFREGNLVARRPIYDGKAYSYLAWLGNPPYIATVNLVSLEAIEEEQRIEPEILHEEFRELATKTHLVKRWKLPPSELDISEAPVVIGVGGGVDKKEFMGVIENLAALIEGAVGGSRPAVFNELIPLERQIGATGKFINADIYIPIGISGSTRHTVGIRNAKHTIAINIFKDAPIFKFAHFGFVGDLYEVVPKLTELVEELKILKG